ncbi:hypothetical protein Pla110_20220 [Polystyrenella longa]|uniref:PSP1 C-terminal domain-containing protein n=1 Tax=Polystyrenella longa TaxID=2528007 RepID=A0A518CM44_9PLAN|nr:regulatory iron-sulfur-containing complex subunit RicT [Polystyrenella longa]QDU80295.1 hypothetical protein Pla110_20220 [Polystyrenella longa]
MVNNYIVRYGNIRKLAEFTSPKEQRRSDQVIVKSDRGTEWGEVLSEATERSRLFLSQQKSADLEKVGRILRDASDDDWQKKDQHGAQEKEKFQGCEKLIQERKLQMQLVDAEYIFGGERLIFYYLAEKRVDFRELVKSLASQFKTRIEMRQIGVRDEAKLLADYGDCGKPTCCNTHLDEMPPVSMKMAKLQKATLDPNKISGRCGRLKCCLRYEYDTYVDMRRELPKLGAMVITKKGQGKVVGQEVLAQKVWVQFDDSRKNLVEMTDIVTVIKGGSKKPVSPAKEPPTSAS